MAEREPVKLDYTTSVPERVLGHCCYYRRCVWSIHPVSIEVFAAKLMYRQFFSVEVFRRFVDITRDKEEGGGPKFSRTMYTAVIRYAILRSAGYSHAEAMQDVMLILPAQVRSNARALNYFEETVRRLVEKAESYVEANIHRAPRTGWSILTDETYTLEPLFFPASFLPRILAYALNLPRTYTDLVFCDDRRCYPTPAGIWPDDRWLQLAGRSLRHDVYFRFMEEFGAVSIMDYLTNLDVDEVAISVRPGRRWAKVVLYVPVKNPEEHVVRVARMQELADKLTRQLENLLLHDLERIDEEDGLKILGITEEDIARAVKKLYMRKKRSV